MTLTLKGSHRPGGLDKRYYMIRVQVAGKRIIMSARSRDLDLATKRQQLLRDTLLADPLISRTALVRLVLDDGREEKANASEVPAGVSIGEAFSRCFHDPAVWRNIRGYHNYKHNADDVLAFFGRSRELGSITTLDVKTYVQARLADGYAASTINGRLACLGRAFRAMGDYPDGPKQRPAIRYLQANGARTFVLSRAQEAAIFQSVRDLDSIKPGPQGGPPRKQDACRYLDLFTVLVETGMRLGEALRLRWADLEMSPGTSLVKLHRVEELKSRRGRTVPMTAECRSVLERLRVAAQPSDGPFSMLDKRRAQSIWSSAVKLAGIQERECVIHCLRHTCATRLLRATGNIVIVRDWLGHTSIQTTADTYAHVESPSMREAAKALDHAREKEVALSGLERCEPAVSGPAFWS